MTGDSIITVSNVGKKYRIRHQAGGQRYATLRDTLAAKAKSLILKRKAANGTNGLAEEFWALRDVSFEIKRGEVVGIIGRNGAGKSTLLKILSRITESTTGRVHLRGRVASLLEVGTGFHPELTGRENIFLNGAILGMSRVEVRGKFDEIVAFAEVEKFLDTPVKRYSSGMYVRLAFAVAAHLEPEILIVDEVLAVGDAEFQKKCLGKMRDVSHQQGRTVLFVSHNMAAIAALTQRCLLLGSGALISDKKTDEAMRDYMALGDSGDQGYSASKSSFPYISKVEIQTSESKQVQCSGKPFGVAIHLKFDEPRQNICLSFQIVNQMGTAVAHCWAHDSNIKLAPSAGTTVVKCHIPSLRLNVGCYRLVVYLTEPPGGQTFEVLSDVCSFSVEVLGRTNLFGWNPNACAYFEDFVFSASYLPNE